MLAPKRQAEIAAVTDALQRFHPTRVAVELAGGAHDRTLRRLSRRYARALRNEVVQLGFRLAQASGLAAVDGIDVDGEFPYEAVDAFAKQHGQSALLDAAGG